MQRWACDQIVVLNERGVVKDLYKGYSLRSERQKDEILRCAQDDGMIVVLNGA